MGAGSAIGKVSARLAAILGGIVGFGVFATTEWATNGGVGNSIAGMTGIPEWFINVLLFFLLILIVYLMIAYFFGFKPFTKSFVDNKTGNRATSTRTNRKRGG